MMSAAVAGSLAAASVHTDAAEKAEKHEELPTFRFAMEDQQGRITEGGSSNAWIVSRDGVLITHPLGSNILPGITRSVVIDTINAQGLAFEERTFTVEEAYGAREAFITSASQTVLPVVSIDGRPVGNGVPGLIATGLRRDYHDYAEISD